MKSRTGSKYVKVQFTKDGEALVSTKPTLGLVDDVVSELEAEIAQMTNEELVEYCFEHGFDVYVDRDVIKHIELAEDIERTQKEDKGG